jgi:hypothetical protein
MPLAPYLSQSSPTDFFEEAYFAEEQDRTLGLVLRRGRYPLRDRDVGQEALDLHCPHVAGVSLVVMQHEARIQSTYACSVLML